MRAGFGVLLAVTLALTVGCLGDKDGCKTTSDCLDKHVCVRDKCIAEENLDECAENLDDCDANAICTDQVEGYECACLDGYEGSGTLCSDIDECATDNGGCGDPTYWQCTNLEGDAPTCSDIDECATDNGGCGNATYWQCTNNAGAAPACSDINECATNNGGCGDATSWTCANNTGAAPTCSDIDECALATDTCSASALCINSSGAYGCLGDDPMVCFDGQSDSGSTLPITSAVATLSAATVEFWFKGSLAYGERQFFVFHGDNLNDARGVSAALVDAVDQGFSSLSGRVLHLAVDGRENGGNLNARGFDIDASLPGFNETRWHHYAFVYSGTDQRAFIDGVELTVAQQRDGAQNTSFTDAFGSGYVGGGGGVGLDIGWFPRTAIRYLAGNLEDLRVSNIARYTGTFVPPYPLGLDANTLAFWDLDEGTGTSSADLGSGGYDITWNGVTWGECPTQGVSFNGSTDGLQSSAALALGLTSQLTIEYWIKPTSIGSVWMKLLNIHNAANRDVDMELRTDGKVYCSLFDQSGGNHGSTSTTVLTPGQWYHVACSYDGTTQRMFINGTLETETAWTGQLQLNDFVTISGFESDFVHATLDEFRLSTSARYTATFTPPTSFIPDPDTAVLWSFDEGTGTASGDVGSGGLNAILGSGPNVTSAPSWTCADRLGSCP